MCKSRIIEECSKVEDGFNFYAPSDTGSAGFKYRKGNTLWTFRYSKHKNYTSFFQRFIYSKTVIKQDQVEF